MTTEVRARVRKTPRPHFANQGDERINTVLLALARALRESMDSIPGLTLRDVREAIARLRRLARERRTVEERRNAR